MTRKTSPIPRVKNQDDLAISDEEKAEALAKNFEKFHKLTADFDDELSHHGPDIPTYPRKRTYDF